MFKLSVIAVGVVLASMPPAPARCDAKAEARRHFDVGTRLFEVEDYRGAAVELERSVRLYPTKNGYFNLANCYKALHRYRDALQAISELERRFETSLDRTMRRKKNALKALILELVGELTIRVSPGDAAATLNGAPIPPALLGKPIKLGPGKHRVAAHRDGYRPASKTVVVHSQRSQTVHLALSEEQGALHVETSPEGATVLVDGRVVGATPMDAPLSLAPGEYLLTVRLEGFTPHARTIVMAAGVTRTIAIQLEAAAAAAAPPRGAGSSRRSIFKPLMIAGIAGAAAAAAVSATFYGLAAKQAADFETLNDAYAAASTDQEAETYDERRREARDRTERYAIIGLSFGIATGVLGAASVFFALRHRQAGRQSDLPRARLEGGALTVRF